jgi:fructose-1-phosphate kinase PfkB-like protein
MVYQKLDAAHIAHNVIKAEGITRSNITLQEANGTVTKINEPGFELSKDVLAELHQTLNSLELKALGWHLPVA